MKKILIVLFLSLSLMVCMVSSGWAGGFEDLEAGIASHKSGDYDKAIQLYTKAIESGELSQENQVIAYNNRGLIWMLKENNDRAIADYTKAIELNPNYAPAYNNRGFVWMLKGNNDRVIADSTRAIELRPNYADAYFIRASGYAYKGEKNKALSDLEKAITLDKSYKERAQLNINFMPLWGDEDFKKLIE